MPFKKRQKPGGKLAPGFSVDSQLLPPLVCRVDRYFLAVTPHPLELYHPFNQGEKRVILATADIVAGVDGSTALAVDDVAGFYCFAAEFFTAESLTV